MTQLSRNLAYLIAKHQTNPNALSKATGVQQPTIHRILKGESGDPRTGTLQPLADHFGVTVEQLRQSDLTGKDGDNGGGNDWQAVSQPQSGVSMGMDAEQQLPQTRSLVGRSMPPATREFRDALPDALHQFVGNSVNANGHTYRFDYLSEKIVASFATMYFQAGKFTQFYWPIRTLWHMSSFRLLTGDAHPERHYYVFFNIHNDSETAVPITTITKLTAEASLHGIRVLWTAPEGAAIFVGGVEKGVLRHVEVSDEDDGLDLL